MLLRIFRFHSLQQHTGQGEQLLPLFFRDAADDPLKVTADGRFDLAADIQPLFRGAHQRFAAIIGVCDPLNESILLQLAQRAGNSGQGLFDGEPIFVPNAWNDFVFAYTANVLGFLGAAAVLVLLAALCLRTLNTARSAPDALGSHICVGVFAALFLQTVINLGMNLQVLPVIGVTLPFFSAGGSSALMMYLCVGIVLSVRAHSRADRNPAEEFLA